MEKELELLRGFVAKTLNRPISEVAELYTSDDENKSIKEDGLNTLLDLDAERVTKLKATGGDTTKAHDDGYKKATKEILSKREDELKSHYGITSELTGLNLVGEIVSQKTKALQSQEVTPDQVKMSPTYQTEIGNLKDTHIQNVEKLNQDHETAILGFKKKESMTGVIQAADQLIDKDLNPVWSKDPVRAISQRKIIHEGISNGNFKANPGGLPIVLDAEGKALEDEHGHPVPFKAFVTEKVTALMDLHKAKPRDGGGDLDDDDGAGGEDGFNWNGQKPADDKEYISLVQNATSLKEKVAIKASHAAD